jgi:Na+/H+ antiporter NhaD/arsenite permease-like protein
MMPALDWLQNHAAHIHHISPATLYWGSGTLSSVLDNAPTYVAFLSANHGAFFPPDSASMVVDYIRLHHGDLSVVASSQHDLMAQAIAALQAHFPGALKSGHVTIDQVQMAMSLNDPFQINCLKAISIGSVFFGANTYIGNGPNFLVKAIADHQKAHTPTFVGYILRFTLPFMLPMLLIVWLLFFR